MQLRFLGEIRIRSGTVAIDESFHEETKPAALKRDESHINLTREHVKQIMTNLFEVASHPKNIDAVDVKCIFHIPSRSNRTC
jgi:hypothetical protein